MYVWKHLPVMKNETGALKHTRLNITRNLQNQKNKRVCLKTLCLSSKMQNVRSNIQTRNHLFQKMKIWAEHVCMFENPLPVMENETNTLKHTRLLIIQKATKSRRVRVYVWGRFPWQAEGFQTYMHAYVLGDPCLNRPPEAQKSSFDQAFQNASKHLQKPRFGHTFWSRQDVSVFGFRSLRCRRAFARCWVCMYVFGCTMLMRRAWS